MAKYRTDQLFNVALVGHGNAGKTTLLEALLFRNGAIGRMGKVDDGTTVSDWDPEEHRRGISINLSLVPVEYGGTKINFIDTPGYQDFVGEVISALHVVEAGLLVVDAVAGAQVGTELAWDRLNDMKKPRLAVINRLDRENADFTKAVESLRSTLGEPKKIVPFQIPIGQGDSFKGVISLIDMKAYMGAEGKEGPIPPEFAADVEAAHQQLVEAAAEADDDLILKYLDGEELTVEEVRHGLHKGVAEGSVMPVYACSASTGVGLDRLVQALRRYVPSPIEHKIHAHEGSAELEIAADGPGLTAVVVFKTIIDRYVGRMSYVRVFAGKIAKDGHLINARTGKDNRIANLFVARGKELIATDELVSGDIGVITKLDDLQTGDTLSTTEHRVTIDPPAFPRPLYSIAVVPATQADSAKIGQALHVMAEEDQTLSYQTISTTKQTVLQGMGEAHVDIAVNRLNSKFAVKVETSIPKVPYQETIAKSASASYRHKKQTGGAGQFAEVHMRVEPLGTGSGFEFADEIVGGTIPGVFLPSIEKGVRQMLENGVIAGYPVVGVRAAVFDGKHHPVDSKDIAFQTAGREVFKLCVRQAQPVLLEPIYQVDVTVPDEYMGDVMGDFNTRRGRVLGMEQKGNRTVVKAMVPLAEILRYSTELRSMTQGRGTYTIEFDHYEQLPNNLAAEVIAQHKPDENGE